MASPRLEDLTRLIGLGIHSGILSLVQMSRLKLFGGYYLGTGLISVVGTSFATLSTANAVSFHPTVVDSTFIERPCLDL